MFRATRISLITTLVVFAVLTLYWLGHGLPMLLKFGVVSVFVVYVIAYRSLVAGKSWAWWVWLSGLIVCLVIEVPYLTYNLYFFVIDAPRYIDSPAAILVIAITAIFFVVPQSISLVLLVASRTSGHFPWQATNNSSESDALKTTRASS